MTVQSWKTIDQSNLNLECTQALKWKIIFVIHRLFVIVVIFNKYPFSYISIFSLFTKFFNLL